MNKKVLICFLMVLFSINSFFSKIYTGNLKYSKDILLVAMFIGVYINIIRDYISTVQKDTLIQYMKRRINYIDMENIFFILFLLILSINVIISPNIKSAVYVARVYIIPFLAYYIFKNLIVDREIYKFIVNSLTIITLIISAYAIVQSLFLKESFLRKVGYLTADRLPYSYYLSGIQGVQRAFGTFSAPNTLGLFLAIVILIVIINKDLISRKLFIFSLVIMTITIILTFSRSAWIALICALLVLFNKKLIERKNILIMSGTVVGVIIVDLILFRGRLTNTVGTLVSNTITGKDTSMVGHLNSLVESMELAVTNVTGLGLGLNGPKSLMYSNINNLTESGYFLAFYDVGLLGFVSYFGFYVSCFVTNVKELKVGKFNYASKSSIYILIALLLVYMVLPHVHEAEPLLFAFIFLGLSKNRSLNSTFNN